MTGQNRIMSLTVSEVFGPTWQGEGSSAGSYCGFLRLANCNLACRWCDTPYTWDWERFDRREELHPRSVADVAADIQKMSVPLLVISGGEPLLQQRGLESLFAVLPAGLRIEVETNGTVLPKSPVLERVSQFNVSPKLSSAGDAIHRRICPGPLSVLAESGKARFKFVAETARDLDEANQLASEYHLAPVQIMPQGTTADEIVKTMRELAPHVLARGWDFGTRLHVLLHDNRRGV